MPGTAAHSIGITLARLGTMQGSVAVDDPPTSREAIVELLHAADEPLTIERISRRSGLHANTVRTHLDVLQAAGRVTRRRRLAQGPGRPPWEYAVADDGRSLRARLAAQLVAELEDAPPELVREVAQRWANANAEPGAGAGGPDAAASDSPAEPRAADPDEAVQQAAATLNDLGFDARVDAVGDRIELRSCPHAALVADRPMICDIHAALLGEVLAESGQPVTLRRLDVQARPGLCVAHLDRSDLVPARSIETSPRPEPTDVDVDLDTPRHSAFPADTRPPV